MAPYKNFQCLIGSVFVFVFIVIFDKLINTGGYMAKLYEKNASLWRPKDQIAELMYLAYAIDAVVSLIITCLFLKYVNIVAFCETADKAKSDYSLIKHGLYFGLQIGLFMAALQLCGYISMPISFDLAKAWFVSSLAEGLGIGLLLSILCHKSKEYVP